MEITAFDLAMRFVGVKELPGTVSNPLILAMLRLDANWPTDDEVPWCSAFPNFICWELRLPRSKNLGARSWLRVGRPISVDEAKPGFDVCILTRGEVQPGPEVLNANGHVGFFARVDSNFVWLLGGNQSDGVSVAAFNRERILGIRRLL